jgi:hypothetical protein
MNSAEKFNQFAQERGASTLYMDENLILQKELKQEIVFWGSVYGSAFVEMPDNALTSENEYRKWCWKTTGMMPEKRSAKEFDKYVRPRMLDARVRATLAGMEYGAHIDDVIEDSLYPHLRNIKSVDNGWEWAPGEMVWCETIDKSRGEEVIIRIKELMKRVSLRESTGVTEGKIRRGDVCKRLVHYGRQVGGRDASVNRWRCAYALPIEFLEGGFEALENGINTQVKSEG